MENQENQTNTPSSRRWLFREPVRKGLYEVGKHIPKKYRDKLAPDYVFYTSCASALAGIVVFHPLFYLGMGSMALSATCEVTNQIEEDKAKQTTLEEKVE